MAIEGPLKELNIHDVFQLLDLGRKTGVLRVTSALRQNAGTVHFDRGAVVAAQIASNPHPLGALLLRSGKVREEDLAHARALQQAGDQRRLGEILVALGAIGKRELDRIVRQQVEEVVFELMSWSEGYFSFVERTEPRDGIEAEVSIPTEALLMEAARRIDEWSRIETKIPHLGVIPKLKAPEDGVGSPLDLVPFEWEVLAVIDGRRDLRDIADALGRSEFDVARTAYGLTTAGVIVLEEAPARVPASAPDAPPGTRRAVEHLAMGDFESARQAAAELIAADPESADAHVLLGRALLGLGRYDEAEQTLILALHLAPQFAAARRLLGLAQVALGQFGDATETWDRWLRLPTRPPEEDARTSEVQRLRDAAQTLAGALRSRHG